MATFATHSETEWILLTGQPGCGKTTAVKRLSEALARDGVKLRGFVTEEVLVGGKRVGFDVVTIPDRKRGILSRKGGPAAHPKTGQYSVDVASFEKLALPTIEPPAGYEDVVLVLDEIGRMELHSAAFAARVEELLKCGTRLVGAITAPIYGHRVAFCDAVSASRGVETHRLTAKTRDEVATTLEARLLRPWAGRETERAGKKQRRD